MPRYYMVMPVPSPFDTSAVLDNLLPFTDYNLLIRIIIGDKTLESKTVTFSTSSK